MFLGVAAVIAALDAAVVAFGTDMDGSKTFVSTAADQVSLMAFGFNAMLGTALFGAIAVARLPEESAGAALAAVAALPAEGPLTAVVLHEVRDPGNVGTLLRTADAAGADLVLLTRTSADPYSPKAVRAAVGSTFHLPVIAGADAPALLDALAGRGITAAATSGYASTDLFDTALPERVAWILGNEARGLDEDTLAAAPLAVRIPLAGHAESLNVHTAATVCLFETLRRRRAR